MEYQSIKYSSSNYFTLITKSDNFYYSSSKYAIIKISLHNECIDLGVSLTFTSKKKQEVRYISIQIHVITI